MLSDIRAFLCASFFVGDYERHQPPASFFFLLKSICLGLQNKTLNKKGTEQNRGLFCSNATQKEEREKEHPRGPRARRHKQVSWVYCSVKTRTRRRRRR